VLSFKVHCDMIRLTVMVLLVLVGVGRVAHSFSPNYPMERFTLDLDVPPSERWNHILGKYNSSVPYILKYFDSQVCNFSVILPCNDTFGINKQAVRLYGIVE